MIKLPSTGTDIEAKKQPLALGFNTTIKVLIHNRFFVTEFFYRHRLPESEMGSFEAQPWAQIL
jgi:hypothetical protein